MASYVNGYAKPAPVNPLIGLQADEIASLYGKQKIYSITRNGKKIGTHILEFQQEVDSLIVSVDSSISVRVLGIPVYRLSYVASEVWRNDTLVSASATTTEKGVSNHVEWTKSENTAEADFASNHWHPGVLTAESVFNTLTGEVTRVNAISLGPDRLEKHTGDPVDTDRFQYQDDIPVNVWYDKSGLWFKMAFEGSDGSLIQYLRVD